MWDVLSVSFIERSTSQGCPALIMSRELYYGCYKDWGNMAIGQERLGEYTAEKGKLKTVCTECHSYFEIWSRKSGKMDKELGEDEPGPAAGHPSR